jgi:hypothetical protein
MYIEPHGPCPFEEGDRVDHRLFGFGTVTGASVAVVGASERGYKIVPKGWRVPVTWDDPGRQPSDVGSSALTKVSSPDARPFTYWDRQWQLLLQSWKAARKAVEDDTSAFRPVADPARLQILQRQEDEARHAMQCFLDDEAAGRH